MQHKLTIGYHNATLFARKDDTELTHTRRTLLVGALALPALMLAGCSTKTSTPTTGSTSPTTGSTASNAGSAGASGAGAPKLAAKAHYKVGFAQVESNNPFRLAETKSMQDEAAKRGDQIVVTDATGSDAKQISDINTMIAQQVDAIFLAPHAEKPLASAVLNAKRAGIPVILIDRRVDPAIAKPGQDYVTFIGSDFVAQGKRAADWLIKSTNGKAKIIELEGSAGSSPAIDRKKGFDDEIKTQPGMTIVASQNADFNRDKGRQVMETLLQSHPEVTAVYAHNDEMALGAVSALQAGNKQPGTAVKVVSIDGSRDAVQAIVDGKINYVVQSSPFFGPVAFQSLSDYAAGKPIPARVVVKDNAYDASNAKQSLPAAF